jgi:hypothetical protein
MDNPDSVTGGGVASPTGRAFVPDGIEPTSVSPVPASIPDAVEDLGEALFYLSDKLRGSGFLNDDARHADYEGVVAAFQKLERMIT